MAAGNPSASWQMLSTAARGQTTVLPTIRTRPVLATASTSLWSTFASPSAPSSSRSKSSFNSVFRLQDMYASDPVLGQRAKVLNDWNAKPEVDDALFENDVLDQYAALKLETPAATDGAQVGDTDGAQTGEAGDIPMVLFIKRRQWAKARLEFEHLHAAGGAVSFDRVYLRAAVHSLSDAGIADPEDRLEWFILYASLIPEEYLPPPHKVSNTVLQQHRHIADQLLCYPAHLSHLSRVLVLLAAKGVAPLYFNSLLKHIVQFAPPGTTQPLVESICKKAGFASDSPDRANAFEAAISGLLAAQEHDEVMDVVQIARTTCARRFVKGYLSPPIRHKHYLFIVRSLRKHLEPQHPHLRLLERWVAEDYPDEPSLSEPLHDSDLLRLIMDGRPPPEALPRAIFLLTRSTTALSTKGLSNVLEALYMTPTPRPRLLALLYRRIVSLNRRQYAVPRDHMPFGEQLWLGAEIDRLNRLGRPADALSLYAARYQWVMLPTSEVWDAFRFYQPEVIDPLVDGQGSPLPDPLRKCMPTQGILCQALYSITLMHGSDVERLDRDYREFLTFADVPAPRARLVAGRSAATEQAVPDAPQYTPDTPSSSLFEDEESVPPAAVSETPFEAWSAPELAFDLPLGLRPSVNAWIPWVIAYSRIDPQLGISVLRDMRTRGVRPDARIYTHVFVELVKRGQEADAVDALDELQKAGGVSYADGRAPLKTSLGHSHLLPGKADAEGTDYSPPVTAWVFVRLIRALALAKDSSLSVTVENKMRALGFTLTDLEKREMQVIYDIRHRKACRYAANRGLPMPPALASPWGKPGEQPQPGQITIHGHLSGEKGISFESRTEASDWSNTLLEEGSPLRARTARPPRSSKSTWPPRPAGEDT